MKYPEQYCETDTCALFVDSLQFSEARVLETEQNVRSVPWAILATHTLVQMSCVFALDERDSTQTACLSDQKLKGGLTIREKTVELLHSGRFEDLPEPYLASPASLLRRVQDKNDIMGTQAFELNEDMTWNLDRLNEFRDTLIHFVPSSWNLELEGLPSIFKSAFELALLTLRTPGEYNHRLGGADRNHAEQICLRMIEKLKEETQCTAT
ncbi:MAG: hypothetical protein R3B98_08675 [Hyphomonas sp.]